MNDAQRPGPPESDERALPPSGTFEVLKRFVEEAPAALAMFDTEMRYLAASRRWRRDYGIEDVPLEGLSHYEVFPDVARRWKEVHQRCLAGATEHSEEDLFVRADGHRQWLRWDVQPWRTDAGRVGGLIMFAEDITRQKEAEQALQDANDQQHAFAETTRLLLETASQGIISVDHRGTILTANAAIERMFGYTAHELVGESIEKLLPTALRDAHVRHRREYFATPRPRPMGLGLDLVGEREDGSAFPVEVSLNHVATPADGTAIAFVTDITKRKQAEQALHERTAELEQRSLQLRSMAAELTLAEQRAREELAKTLHDGLQQLLFSTKMTLDRLARRLAGPTQDEVGLLERARRELDESIQAARSLSVELFPPMLHTGGLSAALAWLAERMLAKYGLVVELTAEPLANPARRDVRVLVFESVRELLFNVVKHAQVNRVSLDLALTAGGDVRITITDTGVGFDPSALLASSQQPRTGLGLFSVRERLALLGGGLDIASAPGQGSRFTLVAPRS